MNVWTETKKWRMSYRNFIHKHADAIDISSHSIDTTANHFWCHVWHVSIDLCLRFICQSTKSKISNIPYIIPSLKNIAAVQIFMCNMVLMEFTNTAKDFPKDIIYIFPLQS